MSSQSHLKRLALLYNCTANTLILPTMTKKIAPWLAGGPEIVPQPTVICPIHLLLVIMLLIITSTMYLALRSRTVYLVDYACFRPNSNLRITKATFHEHARVSSLLDDSIVNFIGTILDRSGMSDETCAPPVHHYIDPCCVLDEARVEAELVVFSVIDDLLAKTCIKHDAIGGLITNCSAFCPIPSIADMIVNKYRLRGDIRVMNLSGMACSASMIAVGLASNMLQVMPRGSHVLVVSTEIIGPSYYSGNKRSMELSNILLRVGGVAKLLLTSRSKARFRLVHFTRTITAANNSAYRCVYQEEDDKGNLGIALSRDITVVAGDALKANIMATGPYVLPTSELLKFSLFNMARKVSHWRKIKPYIPNFCVTLEHFCIHAGGPAVISSVQHGLNLSDQHVEPSWMTLHRFGNQLSASVWYELAYIDVKGQMKKSDRVWMIGFGAGYECNTASWLGVYTTIFRCGWTMV